MRTGVRAQLSGTRRWYWLAGGALVMVALLVWWLWPAPAPQEPRARQYKDATACLLTDDHGVSGPEAAPVWAGMQDASLKTHGQVRYLAVVGEQTVDNARTFLGTLLLGRCAVIIAAGEAPVDAVEAMAARYPNQRFIVVRSETAAAPNVAGVVPGSHAGVRAAIAAKVSTVLNG